MDDAMANDLTATLNRALRERRYSASRASIEAGSPDLIRNIRRGRMPSLERLKALCEVLELDFYVGPRRRAGAVDVGRLARGDREHRAHARRSWPCARARGPRRCDRGGLRSARSRARARHGAARAGAHRSARAGAANRRVLRRALMSTCHRDRSAPVGRVSTPSVGRALRSAQKRSAARSLTSLAGPSAPMLCWLASSPNTASGFHCQRAPPRTVRLSPSPSVMPA